MRDGAGLETQQSSRARVATTEFRGGMVTTVTPDMMAVMKVVLMVGTMLTAHAPKLLAR